MAGRINELMEMAQTGTLTEQETAELAGLIREIQDQLPVRTTESIKEIAERFVPAPELSDEVNQVIDELDYHVQECFRIAQAKAPSMPIAQVMSTMLLQMHCVVTPASKYNGIFYSEHYRGHGEDEGVVLPDFGFIQLAEHMSEVLENPEGYSAEHQLKPIGEHDFEYELDPARKVEDPPLTPDGDFYRFLVVFAKDAYDNDPEAFQGEREPHLVLADLFEEAYTSDRQLEDTCFDAWAEAFPEPDADAENPAGR